MYTPLTLLLALLPLGARAGAPTDCTGICAAVEAADDLCDSLLGEADALCVQIDAVADGQCEDPSAAGEEVDCAAVCAAIDAADDACDETRGEAYELCLATDHIADDLCGDEDGEEEEEHDADGEDENDEEAGGEEARDDGAGTPDAPSTRCATSPVAGGLLLLPLVLVARRRR